MKCPECEFQNSDEMQFCGKCGAKLAIICPECEFKNPDEFSFCGKCGESLAPAPQRVGDVATGTETTFDKQSIHQKKLAKIQNRFSRKIQTKILSQNYKIEGEYKQVTILFCDMKNFTPLVEELGPEKTYNLMEQINEILIHNVHFYGGIVNEMTGDGIFALFGAPKAMEDAPQRAIRSSIAIHKAIIKFNEDFNKQKTLIPSLEMRIGINSGPVVVGSLGNNLKTGLKVVGSTVNLASRLESLAEPGTTYISETTFKLSEGLFRFESLGKMIIKGKKKPEKVYRLISSSNRRTRFDVSAEQGLTPFLGRNRELEILIDGFKRSKTSGGQLFSIVAEAGLGKSRLLYEFRKTVANENVDFVEGKCLSYSQKQYYQPIKDILKHIFEIEDEDIDNEINAKIKRKLMRMDIGEEKILPYLLEMLSVQDSGIDDFSMSPEAKKDRTMEAVMKIIIICAKKRPIILAIEDLHWIDKSSEDYLINLVERISGTNVFLIFTYRPEYTHSWGNKTYYNQITLNRLPDRNTLSIIYYLLKTRDIDTDIQELILEKTEGIPFYLEEFLKSLTELKIIEKRDNKIHFNKNIKKEIIPSTIHDVIMARIDSLPFIAKKMLQAGSVIGREFNYKLIRKTSNLSEKDFHNCISMIKNYELIYERGLIPESTFVFKHALTQQVIYDSILKEKKKELHACIGSAIESLYQDNRNEYFVILASHFIKSEDYSKGAEYLRLAGEKAYKEGAFIEAISYNKYEVSIIEKVPQSDEIIKRIIDARTLLGTRYTIMNCHADAKEAIDPIADFIIQKNRTLSQINITNGSYYSHVEEDFSKAFPCLKKAVKVSTEINDFTTLTSAQFWIGTALSYHCDFKESFNNLKAVLDIGEAIENPWLITTLKSSISVFVYYFQGTIDLAYNLSEEAIFTAEKCDDIFAKGMAYTSYAVSCYGKGYLYQAEKYAIQAAELCTKIKHYTWGAISHHFLGEIYFENNNYKKAKKHFNKSNMFLKSVRIMPSFVNLNNVCLTKIKVMNKEKDSKLEKIQAFEVINKFKCFEGEVLRHIGEIFSALDNEHIFDAENFIQKAIAADKKNGMMFFLAKDYMAYSMLYRSNCDYQNIQSTLNKAIEVFTKCGADGWVEKCNHILIKLD